MVGGVYNLIAKTIVHLASGSVVFFKKPNLTNAKSFVAKVQNAFASFTMAPALA